MTIADPPISNTTDRAITSGPQCFLFDEADWAFYEQVGEQLRDRRVFVTYYKGRLEIVTVSRLHERIVTLISLMITVLAEESNTPLGSAGMTTLRRRDLNAGVEPDASFYIANEERMRLKKEIDLAIDPPPDLAIEVEVTSRLGARKSIYRELGVPEVWQYGSGGLTILLRRGEQYESVERSPTFPQLSPQELYGFVASGLAENQTKWIQGFRRRVRESLGNAG